jgi:hypothetical protein
LLDLRSGIVHRAGVAITAHLTAGPATAALHHPTAFTNADGKAVYRALAISGPVGTYQLEFRGAGLQAATADAVTVSPPWQGSATDPIGDLTARGADLAAVTVAVVGGDSLFVSIRWAAGNFVRDSSQVTVMLDVDQNPGTGHPGINATGTVDAGAIGSEYALVLGASQDVVRDDLRIFRHAGSGGLFTEFTLNGVISYVTDGLEVVIPLAALGEEDGLLQYKLVSTVKVDASGFSGWLDVVPDVGQAAVTVRSASSTP